MGGTIGCSGGGPQGARLLVGALNVLGIGACVLSGLGQVVAMSAAAERLIGKKTALRLRGQYLEAVRLADDERLQAALRLCRSRPCANGLQTVRVAAPQGDEIRLRVVPLAHDQTDIGPDARLLVMVDDVQPPASSLPLGPGAAEALTAAEQAVAGLLLQGRRMQEIARIRQVSRETVRSQVKTVYAKLGVSDHIELLVRSLRAY